MISDIEKQKIEEDELLRLKIRGTLESENKKKEPKFLKFLNSSFGMWFLSSIFLGVVVHFYTRHEEKIAVFSKNEEIRRKLEVEISNRVKDFKFNLKKIDRERTGQDEIINAVKSMDAYIYNDTGFTKIKAGIFQEFSQRTCESLIFELEQLGLNKSTKNEIKKARMYLNRIKFALTNERELKSELNAFDSIVLQIRLQKGYLNFNNFIFDEKYRDSLKKLVYYPYLRVSEAIQILDSIPLMKAWSEE